MRPASAPSPPSRRAVRAGLRARDTAHFAVDRSGRKRCTGPERRVDQQDVEGGGALGELAGVGHRDELLTVTCCPGAGTPGMATRTVRDILVNEDIVNSRLRTSKNAKALDRSARG